MAPLSFVIGANKYCPWQEMQSHLVFGYDDNFFSPEIFLTPEKTVCNLMLLL